VAALVKQLGDEKYAKREAAHKELLRRGEGIVPELDRLAPAADAETADRIRKVRGELLAYLEDIRRQLEGLPSRYSQREKPIPLGLRGLIERRQPRSGDLLLDLLAGPYSELRVSALQAFRDTWESLSADQLERFLRMQLTWHVAHRPRYPAKVDVKVYATFSARNGDLDYWPTLTGPRALALTTRTTRLLNGRPYEPTRRERYPYLGGGAYRVQELPVGKHTIQSALEYEFVHRGERRTGRIESVASHLEVTPADTPDDLIAPKSETLEKAVQSAFVVSETDDNTFLPSPGPVALGIVKADPWYPQSGWFVGDTLWLGLHVPRWHVKEALDVDLCFDVEVHDLKSGKRYPGGSLVVRRGETESGFLGPDDAKAFCAGRDGFVPVKVTLTPSRAVALSDPNVTRYYPGTITTPELRMKVYPRTESKAPSK
jgi:hypothetical protein